MNAPLLAGAVPWPQGLAARYRAAGLWQGQTMGTWFRDRAQRFGDAEALVDGERRLSYEELEARVTGLATAFFRLGLRPLDRAVLQLPNGLEVVEVLLALVELGVVPVLALPAHRQLELHAFAERTGAVAMILADRHAGTELVPIADRIQAACPALHHVIVHGRCESKPGFMTLAQLRTLAGPAHERPQVATSAGEVALLQLSGGSTGTPKLIPRTHDDYLYSVRASAELCALSGRTRYLAALPITHNFTLSSPGVLGVLHAGGTIVSCPQPAPAQVFELLRQEAITLTAAVPSLVRSWLEAHGRSAESGSLQRLTLQVGGAKLDEELARAVLKTGCRLQQVFGMAEGLVNYTRLDAEESTVVRTQGRPLSAWDEVRVVDPDDPDETPVPDGTVGELHTRGPYTIRGYFDDRAQDARHFTADGFYRTGDLVRLTPRGDLVVEGRLGERILRGGEKIAPVEIEEHLLAHPAILDVAVVGVPDVYLGDKSLAFLVLRPGRSSLASSEVRSFLRARGLAEFKLPDAVRVVLELPRTKVGKTDKRALREAAQRSA